MPVLHLPQLIGLALGHRQHDHGLQAPPGAGGPRAGDRRGLVLRIPGAAERPLRGLRPVRGAMVVYDAPDCWKCVEVKAALDALGLAYDAVTVRGDPAARAALVAAQGEPPQVPMLLDGDIAVWDRRRILAYLRQTYGTAEDGEAPYRGAARSSWAASAAWTTPPAIAARAGGGAYHGPVSQISSVTAATRSALPAPCVSCVFWQHDRLITDERHKEAWAESFGAPPRRLRARAARRRGVPRDGPVRPRAAPSRAPWPCPPARRRATPPWSPAPSSRATTREGAASACCWRRSPT